MGVRSLLSMTILNGNFVAQEKFDPKISREDYFIEDILRKQGY